MPTEELTIASLLLWGTWYSLLFFRNRFFIQAKTVLDFLLPLDERREYDRLAQDLLNSERRVTDMEAYLSSLISLSGTVRRNKDGTFDRRGKQGRVLNRDLPGLPQKIKAAQNEITSIRAKMKKYEGTYHTKKSSWVLYKASRESLVRLSPAIISSISFSAIIGGSETLVALVFINVALFLSIHMYARALQENLKTHESAYKIERLLP